MLKEKAMNNKEQIIIDGVDVSGCEWFKDGMCYAECDLEGYTDWECHDEELHNCYFKQLARKTQEYRNLSDILRATDIYSEVCSSCRDEILIYSSISGKTSYTDNEVDRITLRRIINSLKKNKTQECESLEQERMNLTNRNNLLKAELNQTKLLLEGKNTQYNAKVDECKELKRKVELMMDCPDCKVDEYKKALEEIEEYCDNQISLTGDLPFRTTESDILDIINKAKGEIND